MSAWRGEREYTESEVMEQLAEAQDLVQRLRDEARNYKGLPGSWFGDKLVQECSCPLCTVMAEADEYLKRGAP